MPAIDPNGTFCPACTAMSQEIAHLRNELTAARLDAQHYRRRYSDLAGRYYWPEQAPREAVAGDIGWAAEHPTDDGAK